MVKLSKKILNIFLVFNIVLISTTINASHKRKFTENITNQKRVKQVNNNTNINSSTDYLNQMPEELKNIITKYVLGSNINEHTIDKKMESIKNLATINKSFANIIEDTGLKQENLYYLKNYLLSKIEFKSGFFKDYIKYIDQNSILDNFENISYEEHSKISALIEKLSLIRTNWALNILKQRVSENEKVSIVLDLMLKFALTKLADCAPVSEDVEDVCKDQINKILFFISAITDLENFYLEDPDFMITAIDINSPKIVKKLLKAGANTLKINSTQDNALMYAIRTKADQEVIEALLNKSSLNHENSNKQTPLLLACNDSYYYKNLIKLFINVPVENINHKNKRESTALRLVLRSCNKELVKMLLNKDADPNLISKNKPRVLTIAAAQSNAEIVKLLIKNGAKVDDDKDLKLAESPLMAAVKRGKASVVHILVKNKANVNIKNKYKQPILSGFSMYDFHKSYKAPKSILHELISAGIDLNAVDLQGRTLLINMTLKAVEDHNLNNTREDINKNSINDTIQIDEKTISNGKIAVINQIKFIKELIRNNIDKSIRDNHGKTALDYAQEKEHEELVNLLS